MEDKKAVKNEIKNETIETSSFVLSIVSIVTFFIFGLGILPGIVSLVLSILSYKKNKSDKRKNREMNYIKIKSFCTSKENMEKI